MAYNRSSDRDTGSSSFGRSSSGGGFGGGGGSSRSSGGGGGGGSLRGADGMTASQRAATRDSRLGLTTGTTWRGNTAVGPAGGRATGFTNVRTGGAQTRTQRDAVGPGTMPRVTSGQPSRSRVTAQPTSGPRPMVKKVRPAAKKPAVNRPAAPVKKPVKTIGRIAGGLGMVPLSRLRESLLLQRPDSWSTAMMDKFYGGGPTQGGKGSLPPGRSVKDYGPGKGDLGVNPRSTKFRTR